ncbi:MAG: glycosyltransferase family 87 protein, partial [Polyangia bacterium]
LVVRAVWFAIQAILFVVLALTLAAWIGGHAGLVVGLLVPALVTSIPGMVNLQWGQAHLFTFVLSLGAMLAFERKRAPLGGVLLGAAIVFKLFPGLLVVYLLVRRRWREVGWTLAGAAALLLLALVVLGRAPFVEFVRYQLPRIGSGEAFSFFRREWLTISRNFAISGIVFKLGVLGVPGMTTKLAGAIGWIYTLALMALVVWAARRSDDDRLAQAMAWLALLSLGSLRSPLAPNLYVGVGALWLLTLLAARVRRAREVVLIVLAWLVIPGIPPLARAAPDIAVAFVGQLAMVAVALVALRARPAAALDHP